RLR
ncbi:putative membrane protein, partial [Vibrio parahaemolyticus AQ3810]